MSVQARSIGSDIDGLASRSCEGARAKPRFTVDQLRAFRPMLSFLNSKDRDILYLIFVSGKKQKEVQEILGRSQPSLCYDIKRIRKRLRFVFYLNSVFDIFLDFIQKPSEHFDSFEMEILLLMFYTSSFTATSDVLEVPQVKIRYSFDKCLRRMEELELWEIYEIFMVIRVNLNLVRRVYSGSSDDIRREIFIPQ